MKGEKSLTKEKVHDLGLLFKTKLNNQSRGPNALTSPLIVGNLITYRGFKEILFLGGSSDSLFAIDADLNRLMWEKHFDASGPKGNPTATCPGGMTASIAMPGSSTALGRFPTPPPRRPGAPPPALSRPAPATGAAAVFGEGFGRNGSVFAVTSDGYLRIVRQSDGDDKAVAAVKFLPPNAKASSLNVGGTSIYVGTLDDCGGNPNAIYGINLMSPDQKVVSFVTNGTGPSGTGGTAIGNDGTVYTLIASGHGETAGEYNDTVLALTADTLTVKDYFTPEGTLPSVKRGNAVAGVTPSVFQWKGKDIVVAGGRDGAIYLLDSQSLGGGSHHEPLSRVETHTSLWGDFASWLDADSGTRWIYAASNNGIIGFKVEDQAGKPALVQQWTSREMTMPAAPMTTNGLVFALATGELPHKSPGKATLYVLDGSTGKELYSSGDTVKSFSHSGGLAVANGRIYFSTHDNTVYCFGFPAEQPQLTDR